MINKRTPQNGRIKKLSATKTSNIDNPMFARRGNTALLLRITKPNFKHFSHSFISFFQIRIIVETYNSKFNFGCYWL